MHKKTDLHYSVYRKGCKVYKQKIKNVLSICLIIPNFEFSFFFSALIV